MTDLATLGMRIDSTEVETGVAALDKLAAAGGKAEKAVDRLGDEAAQSGKQIKGAAEQAADLAAQVQRMAGVSSGAAGHLDKTASASKLAAHHVQNLAFQFNDLAVQIASGANPLIAFVQQGSQIAGIAGQAGIGIGGMAKEVAGMVGRFALAHPALLAVAAAVGVGTVAFQGFTSVLEKKAPVDDYIKSLGLTSEEAKKLTDAHVTLGDAAGAAWDMIKEALGLDDVFKTLKGWVSDAAGWLYGQFKDATSSVYGAFAATYDNVGFLWKNLPALLGDAVRLATNKVIESLEGLVNGSIQALNWLAQQSNAVFGTTFGTIAKIDLSDMKIRYSAAGTAAAAEWSDSFGKRKAQAMGAWDDFEDRTIARRNARLEAQAKDLIGKRKDAATRGAKDAADAEEKIYKQMMDARAQAQGNVGKLAEDMIKRQQKEWTDADFAFKNRDTLGKDGAGLGKMDTKAMEEADKLKQAALANYLDMLDAVQARTNTAADAMANAFGRVGGAIGDVASLQVQYGNRQAAIDKQAEDGLISHAAARKQTFQNQIEGFGALAGAAKGLFSEHSKGYKAMAAAEQAFAAVQLANTAINLAAGAAKMFGVSGPAGFGLVAAMMAVMASLGYKGGSGGGKSFSLKDYQAAQGAGSVLGDSTAKSDSIARSLDLMSANSDKELEYSNAMVQSLRAIESNIGSLSGLLARQLGISGSFDTTKLGLGSKTTSPLTNAASGILGTAIGTALLGPLGGLIGGAIGAVTNFITKIPVIGGLIGGIANALFGKKVTKTLLDQGIVFNPETIGSILSGGIDGQTYADIQTKTKKKMFGITTSNKTRVNTEYGGLDDEAERQVSMLIGSMRDSILSAAGTLGIDGAQAVLDAFTVDLGKISLKDLKGSEIQEQVAAIFSKLADSMAGATIPALDAFQKVGEGLFETLMRLSKDYQTVDVQLASIGRTFGAVGASSVEARESLIDLFGSLDTFVEQTQFYRDNFLTAAQRIAPIMSAVEDELARLNLSGVDSLASFKSVVDGLDLTTQAGQSLYAALMNLAPGFAAVEKYEKDLADQRQSLQIRLLRALGRDSEATAMQQASDLANTPDALKPLMAQVQAAEAAAELTKQFQSLADSLRSYRAELDGGAAGGLTYRQAMAKLIGTGGLAAAGDMTAMQALTGVGRDFLTLSKDNASTAIQYQRDVAMVRAYLDQAIASADAGGVSVPTPTTISGSSAATEATLSTASSVQSLTAELRAMREENRIMQTKLVEVQNMALSIFRRFEGDGMLVRTDDDTPLKVDQV